MDATSPAAAPAAAPTLHTFEFKGSGGEFFRIWIVNMVLTVLTLGIYSAWAKVRTSRYFYGNTYLAGHPFDYHASPVRILIGRVIAITLLIGYGVSIQIQPLLGVAWFLLILVATPWLVVSSLRFAARNSSYRNVRFNFVGTMGQAAKVYLAWPLLVGVTLGMTAPLARRARDYFYINNHTFGGKPFHTEFSGWAIYSIYLLGVALYIVGVLALVAAFFAGIAVLGVPMPAASPRALPPPTVMLLIVPLYFVFIAVFTMLIQIVVTMIFNLAVRNTVLDGRHELVSRVPPVRMAWIAFTNLLLIIVTIGFYYPWARVRLTRTEVENMGINATTNLDEFTSEAIATQGAIGEEIAGFFDLGIGL